MPYNFAADSFHTK